MFKRNWYWALVVLILLGIGGFAYLSAQKAPPPIVTYKAVTPDPHPESNCASCGCGSPQPESERAQQEIPETPEIITTEEDMSENATTDTIANPLLSDMEANEVDEKSPSDDLVASDTISELDLEAQIEAILGEEIPQYIVQLQSKYPLLSLSASELLEFTQTREGEQEFWAQAKAYSDESLNYISEQFALLPLERLEEAFEYAKQWAAENGGAHLPPQVMQETIDEVKQRLIRKERF